MIMVAAFVTGVYGYTIERLAYRPARNSPRLVSLIAAIGMSIFLQNWVALGQGARDMAVPNIISGSFRLDFGVGYPVMFSYSRLLIIAVVFVLMVALTLYIKKYEKNRREPC